MHESSRWPIDYDALKKGDSILVEKIEAITETKQGTAAYDFAVLKLKGRIESELRDRDKLWTICSEKGNLKILTDDEAVIYNHAEQVKARSSQARRFALQQAVDVSNLNAEQLALHNRNVEVDGRYMQAMLSTRKELSLDSHKRDRPGLPG